MRLRIERTPVPPFRIEARSLSPAIWYVILDAEGYPLARLADLNHLKRDLVECERRWGQGAAPAPVPRKRLVANEPPSPPVERRRVSPDPTPVRKRSLFD